jgi:hypothetical protein
LNKKWQNRRKTKFLSPLLLIRSNILTVKMRMNFSVMSLMTSYGKSAHNFWRSFSISTSLTSSKKIKLSYSDSTNSTSYILYLKPWNRLMIVKIRVSWATTLSIRNLERLHKFKLLALLGLQMVEKRKPQWTIAQTRIRTTMGKMDQRFSSRKWAASFVCSKKYWIQLKRMLWN